MSVLYTNNASTTLSAAITSSATSLSVAANTGALFPALSGADYFYLTIVDSTGAIEIMKVTARSADTFTVVRGQDGTTAQAWSGGQRVELRITKAMLDDFKTDTRSASLPLSGGTLTGTDVVLTVLDNASSSDGSWRGRIVSKNATSGVASFLGNYQGKAGVYAHSAALDAWADLYVNTSNGSGGGAVRMTTSVFMGGNQALHAGNYTDYAASASHTHSYLPLSGGTLTGAITTSAGSPFVFTAIGSGTYDIGALYVNSTNMALEAPLASDSSGASSVPMILTWRGGYGAKGGLKLLGGASAELGGNAVLHAGNYSSYAAPASHTHSYLPLSGGTLTGNRPIQLDSASGGSIIIKGDTGGWGMGLYFKGSDDVVKGSFGALGGGAGFSYLWAGLAYDNTWMTWNSSEINANKILNANVSNVAIALTGAQSRMSFRDADLLWTGYVGFSGNIGVLDFPGRNIELRSGYNGSIQLITGASGYNSGTVAIPYGNLTVQGNTALHAGNYTNYVNSGTHDHSRIAWVGTRTAETGTTYNTPSGYLEVVGSYNNGWPNTYGNVLSVNGGGAGQLFMGWIGGSGAETGELYYRSMTDWRTNWGSWRRVLTNANWSEYAAAASHTHTSIVSPNGASVVSADAAFPSAGQTFQHSLALGPGGDDGHILAMSWANTASVYGAQIWLDTDPTNRMAIRSRASNGTWNGWSEIVRGDPYNADENYNTGSIGRSGINIDDIFQRRSGFIDVWAGGGSQPFSGTTHVTGFQSMHYWNGTTGYGIQVVGNHENRSSLKFRLRSSNGINPWYTLLHDGNYTNYGDGRYVLKTGDTMSGRLTISPGWTTTGRNYSNEWIEFSNYTGLYSPNNGAHFLPNEGTYGPWRIYGSRNGWNGIEFGVNNGNISLMVAPSSDNSGFYNNSYGWQLQWANGTLYVGKNNYGGNTVAALDASNYNSYSPTLTGGNASGTWGINISGYAAYATRIDGASRTQITVGGNANTFYPVALYVGSGSTTQQYAEFVIERGGYDDPGYSGIGFSTFNARFSYKPSGWGYNATYFNLEQLAQTTTMLGGFQDYYHASQTIVWLRGGTRYWIWSIVGSISVAFENTGGTAYAATYVTFATKSTPDEKATYSRYIDSSLKVEGDLRFTTISNPSVNTSIIQGNWNGAGYWGLGSDGAHTIKIDQINGLGGAYGFAGAGDITLKLGTKTVLDSGNYSSYALPLSGGTLTGNLGFGQPYSLAFANGQYIRDNSNGGLVIYSGAALNLNSTSLTANGNTVLHAGNYTDYTPIKVAGSAGYPHAGTGMFPFYNWGGSNGGGSAPTDSTYTIGISVGSHPGDQAYGFQIARNMWNTGLWTRGYDSGWGGWVRLLDSSNYSSYALPLSGSSQSGSWLFNNMGNNHGTYQNFDNVPGFGFYYVQGTSAGPGFCNQYYGFTIGLGNEYAYSSYALQFAIPRLPTGGGSTPYLAFRHRENGSWGSWYKAAAGYADTAGSVIGGLTTSNYASYALPASSYTYALSARDDSLNVDTSYFNKFWSTVISTETTRGTKPSNYQFMVNLGGSPTYGLQFAAYYGGGGTDSVYLRRGSDNGSSTNGANVWQPWREILHSANYTNYAIPTSGGVFTGLTKVQNTRFRLRYSFPNEDQIQSNNNGIEFGVDDASNPSIRISAAGSGSGPIAIWTKVSSQPISFRNYDTNGEYGYIWINSNGTTSYATSSDYRLKNIDGEISEEDSGAFIDGLLPKYGTWKSDGSTFVGFVAHEVQAVAKTEIATGPKDGPNMQAIDYSSPELIANLVAQVKYLRARVEELENKATT